MPEEKEAVALAVIEESRAPRFDMMNPLVLWEKWEKSGKTALPLVDNMRKLLNSYKIKCRYNVISKCVEVDIPGGAFTSDNKEEVSLAHILSLMSINKMKTANYDLNLLAVAEEQAYNPVLEWVERRPWDGISRIRDLCATIEADEEDAKNIILERWLYQTMAMVMYDADAAGILVLQGAQGLGKTWWIRRLVPEHELPDVVRTDAMINPSDKDSVSQAIRYWIVELGEIGSTFRKADIDALKAFLTRKHDIMRRPFGKGDKVYKRCTSFAASVNPTTFLHDETGNRRFWTLACKKINSYHTIDMQQLWAEIHYNLEVLKINWRLTGEETEIIAEVNKKHEQHNPCFELLMSKYNWSSYHYGDWHGLTAIAMAIGYPMHMINQKLTKDVAESIRRINNNDKDKERRKTKGIEFFMPTQIP